MTLLSAEGTSCIQLQVSKVEEEKELLVSEQETWPHVDHIFGVQSKLMNPKRRI